MCYIKGVIDGDGSVCNNRIVIYGTKELLEWIKERTGKTPSYSLDEIKETRK